jgi:regulator of protease activity HflC (stomatin/prohibitin superfamily)
MWTPILLLFLIPVLILGASAVFLLSLQRIIIFEYERGLLFGFGKFQRVLGPGWHWIFSPAQAVRKVDVRTEFVTVAGQEILSADNVGLRVSLAASYQVEDPYRAVARTSDYLVGLHLLLQVHLRDRVGALPIETLMAQRQQLGQAILEDTRPQAAGLGLNLLSVDVKDILFPGELRSIFAQVVNARNEGLAALERARGESAALRNLANAAKLLENNPALYQLRFLQTLSQGEHTLVVSPDAGRVLPLTPKGKLIDRL